MYDIIGDIHGHAAELRALLKRMGYQEREGAYRHPGRTAVFVGDFIDRGPSQVETVEIARAMVEAGKPPFAVPAGLDQSIHELCGIKRKRCTPACMGFLRVHHAV